MGEVVRLVVRSDRIRRRPTGVGGVQPPCEIIILPCVRYVRDDDAPKPTPQRKKGRRRRAR